MINIGIPPRVVAEATRMGRAVTIVYVAVTCGFGVVGCLLVALWIAVLPHVGPAGAPLVVAGVLAVVALGTIAALRHRDPPPAAPPANDDLIRLLEAAGDLTRTDKVSVLLSALLAGLVAGARPR